MLSVSLCSHKLKNPTVLASGILGMNADIVREVVRCGAGAVTLKSAGTEPREGHNNPKVIVWEHGLANCYGLTNQGYKNMGEEWKALKSAGAPIIASVFGANISEFVEVAEYMAGHADIIELNLSCPNTKEHGAVFGMKAGAAAQVVRETKKAVGNVPVSAKLTPQAPDIAGVAKACADAGADAITAINTLGPGMFINIEAARPVLSFKTGGLSGPAIRPVAVRCVYDIYRSVEVPIIGMGGITCGRDAVEMMMAGATAVGIGSAVHYRGMGVFKKVQDEMRQWMLDNSYKKAGELTGAAHD